MVHCPFSKTFRILGGMTKTRNGDHFAKWEEIAKWGSKALKLVQLMNAIGRNGVYRVTKYRNGVYKYRNGVHKYRNGVY